LILQSQPHNLLMLCYSRQDTPTEARSQPALEALW
jgi:hypothetical protein